MRPFWQVIACVSVVVAALAAPTLADQFVVFPKAPELVSPDGRFAVRNAEHEAAAPADFIGTFRSLWLIDLATGRSHKLCDYLGVAAVAWSGNDFLVVTEYVGRRTSRALVFPLSQLDDPVMLDKSTLLHLVPDQLRPTLEGNDHVFVEASRIQGKTLHLRVWGYGQHDANDFRWRCEYALQDGAVSCVEERTSH